MPHLETAKYAQYPDEKQHTPKRIGLPEVLEYEYLRDTTASAVISHTNPQSEEPVGTAAAVSTDALTEE